jgi:hypothetical protein
MAMRCQFFEGTVMTGMPGTADTTLLNIPAGTRINILGRRPFDGPASWSGWLQDYRGGLSRIQFTKATEFIVIEHIASSPETVQLGTAEQGEEGWATLVTVVNPGAVQIKINTTEYFLNPDGSQNNGINGIAAPYPRSTTYQDGFSLNPDVYVLPGQNWEIIYTLNSTIVGATVTTQDDRALMRIVVKYTLYDGTDAVIANKLLEMGVSVKPANIDWYKRKLIEAKGA